MADWLRRICRDVVDLPFNSHAYCGSQSYASLPAGATSTRVVAFLAGHHPRAGVASPLRALPPDVMRWIAATVMDAEVVCRYATRDHVRKRDSAHAVHIWEMHAGGEKIERARRYMMPGQVPWFVCTPDRIITMPEPEEFSDYIPGTAYATKYAERADPLPVSAVQLRHMCAPTAGERSGGRTALACAEGLVYVKTGEFLPMNPWASPAETKYEFLFAGRDELFYFGRHNEVIALDARATHITGRFRDPFRRDERLRRGYMFYGELRMFVGVIMLPELVVFVARLPNTAAVETVRPFADDARASIIPYDCQMGHLQSGMLFVARTVCTGDGDRTVIMSVFAPRMHQSGLARLDVRLFDYGGRYTIRVFPDTVLLLECGRYSRVRLTIVRRTDDEIFEQVVDPSLPFQDVLTSHDIWVVGLDKRRHKFFLQRAYRDVGHVVDAITGKVDGEIAASATPDPPMRGHDGVTDTDFVADGGIDKLLPIMEDVM